MRGMQCPKMLWLDKHKPRLKVIPPEIQRRLDAGNDFGDRAMGMFGLYEEMTVLIPSTTIPDTKAMVQRTQEHLISHCTSFDNAGKVHRQRCALPDFFHLASTQR